MQPLTYQDVLTILRLIDAAPFGRFEVEFEGTKLAVTRGAEASAAPRPERRAPDHAGPAPAKAGQPAADTRPAVEAAAAPQAGEVAGAQPIRSPMAGTFYAAPSPGAPPFVEVGATVKKDDQLGTVEVMKLFTAIRAPFGGTVRAIALRNEELVEKDGTIMWIEPAEGSASGPDGEARGSKR